MKTNFRRLTAGILLLLISAPPLLAQDANQLYEFKFKDPKNDG